MQFLFILILQFLKNLNVLLHYITLVHTKKVVDFFTTELKKVIVT